LRAPVARAIARVALGAALRGLARSIGRHLREHGVEPCGAVGRVVPREAELRNAPHRARAAGDARREPPPHVAPRTPESRDPLLAKAIALAKPKPDAIQAVGEMETELAAARLALADMLACAARD